MVQTQFYYFLIVLSESHGPSFYFIQLCFVTIEFGWNWPWSEISLVSSNPVRAKTLFNNGSFHLIISCKFISKTIFQGNDYHLNFVRPVFLLVLLVEGVETRCQNTSQPRPTQEVRGEEQRPHQHSVEGKHRVNVEKDWRNPLLEWNTYNFLIINVFKILCLNKIMVISSSLFLLFK